MSYGAGTAKGHRPTPTGPSCGPSRQIPARVCPTLTAPAPRPEPSHNSAPAAANPSFASATPIRKA